MNVFELAEEILLIATYTILVVTIFVQYICYKRKLENIEAILFTFSLLFLIITLSTSPFFVLSGVSQLSELFKLLSFIGVALTTPINIFKERAVQISPIWKKGIFASSIILFIVSLLDYFLNWNSSIPHVVVAFLVLSVVSSMIVMLLSKSIKKFASREQIDKRFAVAFIILVPISFGLHYVFDVPELKTSITIPIVFILLAANKLMDDIRRLSLLNPKISPNEKSLQSYMLTERENEIAALLIQGKTYKQISEQLFISLPTVKTHSGNIYRKCGVNSRSQLTALNLS